VLKAFDKKQFELLMYWMQERENIRQLKEADRPKPWTEDAILRDHRWCNVRRMDDKVSQWLLEEWYNPKAGMQVLIGAAGLARLFNWPDTLAHITDGKPFARRHWDMRELKDKLHRYERAGNKVFTGAYIINGARGGSKIDQVIDNVSFMWNGQALIDRTSWRVTHSNFVGMPGIGSFMAGQIVADLLHVVPDWEPADRATWAPIGPGSMRGMNRLLGYSYLQRMSQEEFAAHLELLIVQLKKFKRLDSITSRLEAMDYQNCLCEFDKYVRLQNEEGTVRSKYPGLPDEATD
jgi:hypothetical protein